jgi:Na+-translocating ferredoxin:NAD+ oxidoreductase RnfD subunit
MVRMASRDGLRRLAAGARRLLPPVRLLIVALAILGTLSVVQLRGAGLVSLLSLPLFAVGVDLAFQRIRFRRLRLPEAAIATGLILALLLPPVVPLGLALVVTLAAIGVRHALRWWGHPIFNPAASGALLGAVLFGLAPAWWGAVSPSASWVMIALGAVLVLRSPAQWRIPVCFFAAYAAFTTIAHGITGGLVSPHLILLETLDPAVLFFGLFMVTEPRTSSTNPRQQPLYAVAVAAGAILLAIPFPTIAVLLALLLANGLAAAQRDLAHVAQAASSKSPGSSETPRARAEAVRAAPRPRWSAPRRVGALVAIGIFLLLVAAVTQGPGSSTTPSALITPHTPGSSGGGGGGGGASSNPGGSGVGVAASCTSDNPAIASSILHSLHQALGPSTILSYNPSNGVVVFYDPVNQVTVTETDMYEDYGFAEFNGDDYAVSGCVPSTA